MLWQESHIQRQTIGSALTGKGWIRMAEKVPNQCWECKHLKRKGEMGYYPYTVCEKCGREISFDSINGWHRMAWCPLLKEEKKK